MNNNDESSILLPYIHLQYIDPSTNKTMNLVTPQRYYNMALNDLYSLNKNWLTSTFTSKESKIVKELDKIHSLFKELHADPEIGYQFEDGIEMCKQAVENHHFHSNYVVEQNTEWYENEYEAMKSTMQHKKGA